MTHASGSQRTFAAPLRVSVCANVIVAETKFGMTLKTNIIRVVCCYNGLVSPNLLGFTATPKALVPNPGFCVHCSAALCCDKIMNHFNLFYTSLSFSFSLFLFHSSDYSCFALNVWPNCQCVCSV